MHRPVPVRRLRRAIYLLTSILAPSLSCGCLLGGCSMSFPITSLVPAGDDVTGSNPKVPFGSLLDEEDRRREKAALATALDPQGDGSPIRWENPKTGTKGMFTPQGQAFTKDGKVCRSFVGELKQDGDQKSILGTACAVAAGDWDVRDMKTLSPKA